MRDSAALLHAILGPGYLSFAVINNRNFAVFRGEIGCVFLIGGSSPPGGGGGNIYSPKEVRWGHSEKKLRDCGSNLAAGSECRPGSFLGSAEENSSEEFLVLRFKSRKIIAVRLFSFCSFA